jgi:hypothetical protein
MKNLEKYFNRKWRESGHTLEIQVRIFEDEAGNQHQGLVGTMDGEVKRFTMDQFRANSETYHYIKWLLENYAIRQAQKEMEMKNKDSVAIGSL